MAKRVKKIVDINLMTSPIPPKKEPDPTSFSRAAENCLPAETSEPDTLLMGYLATNRQLKQSKAATITEEGKRKTVEKVQQTLDKLTSYFKVLKKTFPEEDREEYRSFIKSEIDDLIKQHERDGLNKMFLSGVEPFTSSLEDYIFLSELTINTFLNRILYEQKIMNFLNRHRKDILVQFFPSSAETDRERINFRLNFYEQETHNQGQSPVFVEIFDGDKYLKKIVFKPRDACIDKAVIETFEAINQLPLAHKSVKTRSESDNKENLPVYKILSFPDEDASLWEFIDGIHPKQSSVGLYVKALPESPQKELLTTKLQRMDALLTAMHCSDLHKENVIIRGEKTSNPEIIPIDLENIQTQEGATSQLQGEGKDLKLTDEEKQIVRNFNETSLNLPFRHILIGTYRLARMIGTYNNAERLTKIIMEELKKTFILTFNESNASELKQRVLSDIMSYDIPYFTEYTGKLYYGHIHEGLLIGHKKEVLT